MRQITLLVVVGLAACLRFGGALGELWVDEVWSLELVGQVTSPLSILSEIKHDNNHPLNSLFLYWLGGGWPWFVYRLPAVLAGCATVPAAAWCVSTRGRAEQCVVAASVATSYLFIHYSSEARGYSFAVLFALLAYKSLTQFAAKPLTRWSALFVVSVVLGLVSHLAFLYFYGAALVWSALIWFGRRSTNPSWVTRLLQLHAIPLLVVVGLYWVNVRGMELGGGPSYDSSALLLQVASLLLGGPAAGPGAMVFAGLAIGLMSAGLVSLARSGHDDWRFFLLVIVAPIVYLLVAQPAFMFARYFLLAAIFGLLACCHTLVNLWRLPRFGKLLVVVTVFMFVMANLTQYQKLLRVGRGEYLAALELIAATDGTDPLTVSGDHDFGLRKLVEFYEPYVNSPRDIIYHDANDWPAGGVDWLILHEVSDAGQHRKLQSHYTIDDFVYQRVRTFDSASLSGWRWHCYRRVLRAGSGTNRGERGLAGTSSNEQNEQGHPSLAL